MALTVEVLQPIRVIFNIVDIQTEGRANPHFDFIFEWSNTFNMELLLQVYYM